jgi:hypothetical protein
MAFAAPRQSLVTGKVDGCGTASIAQGLKPDGFLRVFGAAKAAP